MGCKGRGVKKERKAVRRRGNPLLSTKVKHCGTGAGSLLGRDVGIDRSLWCMDVGGTSCFFCRIVIQHFGQICRFGPMGRTFL